LLSLGRKGGQREKGGREIRIKRQGDLDAQVLKKPTKPKIFSSQEKQEIEQETGKKRWGRSMAERKHTWDDGTGARSGLDLGSARWWLPRQAFASPCRCYYFYFSAIAATRLLGAQHPISKYLEEWILKIEW
jgi:hypothetical protein